MKQPVYIVNRLDVLEVIRHQSLFTRIPCGLYWGKLSSKEEIIDAINALPRYPDDTLNMSRLAQCIQQFNSAKMIARENRMLIRIWAIIMSKRKIYEA